MAVLVTTVAESDVSSGALILSRPDAAEAAEAADGPYATGRSQGGIRPVRQAATHSDGTLAPVADQVPTSDIARQFARCDGIRLRGVRSLA